MGHYPSGSAGAMVANAIRKCMDQHTTVIVVSDEMIGRSAPVTGMFQLKEWIDLELDLAWNPRIGQMCGETEARIWD